MSDAIERLAWEIAIAMEVHAAIGTATKAKADDIAGMLRADLHLAAVEAARREAWAEAAQVAEEEGWPIFMDDKDAAHLTERERGSMDCAERIAAALRDKAKEAGE